MTNSSPLAGNRIGIAGDRLRRWATSMSKRIADVVAVVVIDLLEEVEVGEKDGKPLAVAPGGRVDEGEARSMRSARLGRSVR